MEMESMSTKRGINPKSYLDFVDSRKRLEFIVTLANLSPSSHNMQPWFFRIDEQSVVVLPNRKLKLEVADIDAREFYLTLGTVIGSLKLISKNLGLSFTYKPSIDLNIEIGRFVFHDLNSNNPDFVTLEALIDRHNSRLPFRHDKIPNIFIDKVKSYLSEVAEFKIISDPDQKQNVEKVILHSVHEAFADKAFCLELAPWVKPSVGHHEDGLPGYNLGMPFILSLAFPFMLRHFNISNIQVKIHKRMLDNASVYALISSNEETPLKWLAIGEGFIQIAVEAQKNNISIGIMQASIENPKDRSELKKAAEVNALPQMFFRLGYCDLKHKHSPRRPLSKVLLK
jgi:nitroreductase